MMCWSKRNGITHPGQRSTELKTLKPQINTDEARTEKGVQVSGIQSSESVSIGIHLWLPNSLGNLDRVHKNNRSDGAATSVDDLAGRGRIAGSLDGAAASIDSWRVPDERSA